MNNLSFYSQISTRSPIQTPQTSSEDPKLCTATLTSCVLELPPVEKEGVLQKEERIE